MKRVLSVLGALVAALWLGRLVLLVALAEHYAHSDDPRLWQRALIQQPAPSEAWFALGRAALPDAPAQAERHLRQAALADPANPRVYALLALLAVERGDPAQASALADSARQLGPMRTDVQYAIALVGLHAGDYPAALRAFERTLRLDDRYRGEVFASLLALLRYPPGRAAIEAHLSDRTHNRAEAWWSAFFGYATEVGTDLALLRRLHEIGRTAGRTLDRSAARAYLNRLVRGQRWRDAYFVWLNQLDDARMSALGTPYNGGFEVPLDGWGFDWTWPARGGVTVRRTTDAEATGQVLEIRFGGQDVQDWALSQPLLLRPARYRFSARVRLSGLATPHGLRWSLHCETGEQALAGAGELLRGDRDWSDTVFEFEIPPDCLRQTLRLALSEQTLFDFRVVGGARFDDLRIERIGRLTDRLSQQRQSRNR